MATTTNYGWTTPDDTALVKDGAAAIRTLGSSVDTTTKNLNPSTTLGDIEYRSSTANTNTRLGIGSTGDILTVAGGVPTWAAPAGGGGITSIASGNLTGTAVNLTSISGTYQHIYLVLRDYYPLADGESIFVRINNISSGGLYSWGAVGSVTTYGGDQQNRIDISNNNSVVQENSEKNIGILYFWDYTNTTASKYFDLKLGYEPNGPGVKAAMLAGGYHFPTTPVAITELNIGCTGTGFGGGSYQLYGVK
jgi:hypothetical protein